MAGVPELRNGEECFVCEPIPGSSGGPGSQRACEFLASWPHRFISPNHVSALSACFPPQPALTAPYSETPPAGGASASCRLVPQRSSVSTPDLLSRTWGSRLPGSARLNRLGLATASFSSPAGNRTLVLPKGPPVAAVLLRSLDGTSATSCLVGSS